MKRLYLLLVTAAMADVLPLPLDGGEALERPLVHDKRLELSLFAEHPLIVTPIGLAIDAEDRLFVVESHTHNPPRGYDGPKSDRIKVFTDRDHDGRCDDSYVFADGLQAAMNLSFSPDGVLYVVCAREVYALRDDDGDGVCDRKDRVLRLDTSERYPHNCWLSITFSRDGWMFVGRGNVSSRAYTIVGTDGSKVSGYGDGGNIVRCRADGSQVEEYATGFWNPFDIKIDHTGRLLCVDNDPDARGPNRFVHVVRGGDYGYRSLYGGGGNHPFQGWNGDVPGTLPMISGTGEAPCGLLECRRAALPNDYQDGFLITVWNENTIERHQAKPRGVSLTAESSVLVSGGKNFRPVALDADSKGNIYFADWVLVDYPNHGRGRIWRLSPTTVQTTTQLRSYFDKYDPDETQRKLDRLLDTSRRQPTVDITHALQGHDPFLHHAASVALAHESYADDLVRMANDPRENVRLACLLAAKRSHSRHSQQMARGFLLDKSEPVKRAALQWIGESMMTALRRDIDRIIRLPEVTGPLFETYLATVRNLDPGFVRDYQKQAKTRARDTLRPIDPVLAKQIAADSNIPPAVRALSVAKMRAASSEDTKLLLFELAANNDELLQMAAIGQLARNSAGDSRARNLLLKLAHDRSQESSVRAEALLALSFDQMLPPSRIVDLLDEEDSEVCVEAARTLRHLQLNSKCRELIQTTLASIQNAAGQEAFAEQLLLCLGMRGPKRPDSIEQWKQTLATGGNPAAGRRVFLSAHATCSKCHTINGVGGVLGPDLSHVGRSMQREQIIHSVLRPSDQFPPQYQAWQVLMTDGRVHSGLQLDHKSHGDIELLTTDAKVVHFRADEIEEYRAAKTSIMPTGLEQSMAISELRDLVAFLASLR